MPHRQARQDKTLAAFLELSRQHFGLAPPRRRPDWRSLLLIGSLGALVGAPALAESARRSPEPNEQGQTAQPVETSVIPRHSDNRIAK